MAKSQAKLFWGTKMRQAGCALIIANKTASKNEVGHFLSAYKHIMESTLQVCQVVGTCQTEPFCTLLLILLFWILPLMFSGLSVVTPLSSLTNHEHQPGVWRGLEARSCLSGTRGHLKEKKTVGAPSETQQRTSRQHRGIDAAGRAPASASWVSHGCLIGMREQVPVPVLRQL